MRNVKNDLLNEIINELIEYEHEERKLIGVHEMFDLLKKTKDKTVDLIIRTTAGQMAFDNIPIQIFELSKIEYYLDELKFQHNKKQKELLKKYTGLGND